MMPNLTSALEQHLIKSLPEYTVIAGLLLVAFVVAMPHIDVIDKWLEAWKPIPPGARLRTKVWQKMRDMMSILYGWLFSGIQGFMASRNPPPAQFTQTRTSTPAGTTESASSTIPVPDPKSHP